MVIKKGIVMKVVNSKAYLLTQEGDFIKVYINDIKQPPNIGSEYKGTVVKTSLLSNNLIKYVAACLIFFTVVLGGSAYAYYKPISTVTISINPSLELKLNRWNKVITLKGLNKDGNALLKNLNIKNKNVDTALAEIVKKAKVEKYITEKYLTEGKIITLNIDDKSLSLTNFKNEINKEHLNLIINASGTTVFKNTDPINKTAEPKKIEANKPSKENDKSQIENNKSHINETHNDTTSNENHLNTTPIQKNKNINEEKKDNKAEEKYKENDLQHNKNNKEPKNNSKNDDEVNSHNKNKLIDKPLNK